MDLLVVIGMAVALAMDCFAISIGMGCGESKLPGRSILRMASYFGLFQFAMPILGWFAGENLLRFIEGFDHWIAFGLLVFVGAKMIRESFEKEKGENGGRVDRTRGLPLLILAVATSIDALAVGLSLAVLRTPILYPAVIIGVVSFAMTFLGVRLGRVIGKVVGKRAELLGGLVLIGIGIKILVGHL